MLRDLEETKSRINLHIQALCEQICQMRLSPDLVDYTRILNVGLGQTSRSGSQKRATLPNEVLMFEDQFQIHSINLKFSYL